jgi:hypothetical protein
MSGLDRRGVFDPGKADRSLLFNTDHPDQADPLHKFGVDDGEGYAEGGLRWRFIGAYLIHGQWYDNILGGLIKLAHAHTATGDAAYAHKAGILLDRIADLYPLFDGIKRQIRNDDMNEERFAEGYVTMWHNACADTRHMALAYDQIFEAIRNDTELCRFLAEKARKTGTANMKTSFADIQRNIENRIFLDALKHTKDKIRCNYPWTDITIITINTVLGWPAGREKILRDIEMLLRISTAADGVTGEKGGYSSMGPKGLAAFLSQYTQAYPEFFETFIKRNPSIPEMYRFHMDTWCLRQYYGLSGDGGSAGEKYENYMGADLKNKGMPAKVVFTAPYFPPSPYTFFWRLFKATGDPAFAQISFIENGWSMEGIPHDLFADNPEIARADIEAVIKRHGPELNIGSVNKTQWHLAILRSGKGDAARALLLDYDSGGAHGHLDGMRIGLYAKGIDLLPDFGYTPLQFGGWNSTKGCWYGMTASHNTVLVNGENHRSNGCFGSPPSIFDPPSIPPAKVAEPVAGVTTLWADGKILKAVRASGPEIVFENPKPMFNKSRYGKQYERTVMLVDISDFDSYILDVFRVVGGSDHMKLQYHYYGRMTTSGLTLEPSAGIGAELQLRNCRRDPSAKPGWTADIIIDESQLPSSHRYLPPGYEAHLRHTDMTAEAEVFIAEAWTAPGGLNSKAEAWLPCLAVRRQAKEYPLMTTFVSVMEPYGTSPVIKEILRRTLVEDGGQYPESNIAVEIRLADGRRDLLVTASTENPLGAASFSSKKMITQKEWGLRFTGDTCMIRTDERGETQYAALYKADYLEAGELIIRMKGNIVFTEMKFDEKNAKILTGNAGDILDIMCGGQRVKVQ